MSGALTYFLVSPLDYGGETGFGFTYQSDQALLPGSLVEIPLRTGQSLGVVVAKTAPPSFKTKPVGNILEVALPPHLVELAQWLHEYYLASPKAVWQTLLPSGLTRKRRAARPSSEHFSLPKVHHQLTDEQAAALNQINQAGGQPILLHGITSSGKTELYLRLAAETIASGRSVIVLVPEITLAPQLVATFEATFGEIIITTHSKMTEAERHRAWQAALDSETPRIVIGPRSSLFLPLTPLGLIIIDEAHESSYKQEQAPRYQADAVAAKLASLTGAQLILGSATPSLYQYYLAERGRLKLVRLTSRANRQPLPTTTIVDLRQPELRSSSRFISQPLLDALTQTLTDGRQSLLFINRRGSASSQICGDCGTVSLCPNCELPLTFHADILKLICHYCNFSRSPAAICEKCGSTNLRYLGGGTKRIEAEITQLLPSARLARLDRDSATTAHIQAVYRGLHDATIDILIGTQMVAKGLNLPNLDLVGVVSADTMLHLPDYTASERTFSLLTQVSGRSGRGQRSGTVIIQTYTPEHPAIVAAARHDFTTFAAAELTQRRLLSYPPYVFLLKLTCSASTSQAAQTKATTLKTQLEQKRSGMVVLGPAPAFVERVGQKFVWHLIVKSKQRGDLVKLAQTVDPSWTIDLDPVNLL